jgi:hypothetical protein
MSEPARMNAQSAWRLELMGWASNTSPFRITITTGAVVVMEGPRYLLIDTDEFLRPGTEYTAGGSIPEKSKPQLKAHQRAITVLGPKRGRWK